MDRSRRYTTSMEVCPACLAQLGDENPECPTCRHDADDWRAIEVVATGSDYSPAVAGRRCGMDRFPEPDDDAEFGDVTVTRSDGVAVAWDDLPDDVAERLLADLHEKAAEDDSDACADEDRADAMSDMEDDR